MLVNDFDPPAKVQPAGPYFCAQKGAGAGDRRVAGLGSARQLQPFLVLGKAKDVRAWKKYRGIPA